MKKKKVKQEKFDQCCMAHREQWKVMVELGQQPHKTNIGRNPSKAKMNKHKRRSYKKYRGQGK
jgi:hypothetical protein